MKFTGWHVAGIAAGVSTLGLAIAWWLLPTNEETLSDEDATDPGSPDAAAAAAGETLAVYCLARATASEEGGQPRSYQIAVACAILNFARSEFPRLTDAQAVVQLVLGSAGAFGRQGTGGRRVSSSRAPIALQIGIARDVLAGLVGDPTDGATQFDSPSGQRAALKKDPLTTKTPQQVADERMSKGYELVVVPGIEPDDLRFWRRA